MRLCIAALTAVIACSSASAIPYGSDAVAEYEQVTPEMIVELREYAEEYWEAYDDPSDPPAPEPIFSFPTSPNFNPFILSNVLFTQVYAHRLVLTPDEGDTYYIEDLLRDDPEVLEAFRHHTITGELITPLQDRSAAAAHVELAVLGELIDEATPDCEPIYLVDAQPPFLEAGHIASTFDLVYTVTASKKKPKPCSPTGPKPTRIPQDLRDAIDNSGLDDFGACWLKDGGWWFSDPGFDCDDYADALAEYLRRLYPDAEIWNLYFTYLVGGHAMTVIRINGYFYLIDPQGGEIRGPFRTAQEVHEAAKKLMEESYGVEFYWIDPHREYKWVEPGWRPALKEPKPWYKDPDMLQHFCDCFGLDPNDYMPPDQPEYNCQ